MFFMLSTHCMISMHLYRQKYLLPTNHGHFKASHLTLRWLPVFLRVRLVILNIYWVLCFVADAVLFDCTDDLFEFLKQSCKVLSPPLTLTHAKETGTGRDERTFSRSHSQYSDRAGIGNWVDWFQRVSSETCGFRLPHLVISICKSLHFSPWGISLRRDGN